MPLALSRLCRTLVLTALALLSLGALASAASARVLWSADAERPWNEEWASSSCEDDSRIQRVDAPAAQGRMAYRIEVRDGDDSYGERCELAQGNPTRDGYPLFREGDERWISFQTYLPDDYPADTRTWNVIMQLKQLHAFGTPAISMEVQDNEFVLMNSNSNGTSSHTIRKWDGPAIKNRWVKFTMRVKFSPHASVGWMELYGDLDGSGVKPLLGRTYTHTMKVDGSGNTVLSHSRIGLYRNSSIQGTDHAFFDGYTIGDDRASVEAAAFGTGSTVGEVGPVAPPPPPPATSPVTAPPPTPPPATGTSGTGDTSRPARRKGGKRRKTRVWLRRKRRGRGILASSVPSRWGRVLPVYGGIRGRRSDHRGTVIIKIRRHRRWHWLTRGWVRSDGRFYLSPAVDTGRRRVVRLRALVPGLGHSRTLRIRVR